MRLSRLSWRVRATALFALGDLVVHQGGYMLGYGDGWREIMSQSAHEYFVLLVPLVIAMVAVGSGLFAAELRGGPRGPCAEPPLRPPSIVRTWVLGYVVLCCLYTLQETCEGLLTGEHLAGFTHLLANGGWIAFAIAVGVAALIALLLRGAAAVLARGSRPARVAAARPRPVLRPADFLLPRARPVARNLAPRGPPAGLL